MASVTAIESGHDFITLYFNNAKEMEGAGKALHAYMKRINFSYLPLQRKDMRHLPGDVPHFHNGIDAVKGPHFHIVYPHRPTPKDWEILEQLLTARLVGVPISHIPLHEREEIS